MRESLVKRTLDNITVVIVAFKNLKNGIFKVRQQSNQNNYGLPNISGKKNYYSNNHSSDQDFPLIESALSQENPNEASDEDSNENLGFSSNFQSSQRERNNFN